MTWFFLGQDEREWRARVERGRERDTDFWSDDDLERECIVGTPERAAERLAEYGAVGVQRVMLNHSFFDDLDTLELLATQVFPKVP